MKIHKFLLIMLILLLLFTAIPTQAVLTTLEDPEYTIIDFSVCVDSTMKYVTVSGKASWEVGAAGTTQLTILLLGESIGFPLAPTENYNIEYYDQIALDSTGVFSFTFMFGMKNVGKEYIVRIGGTLLETPYQNSFIYEPSSLKQIKINGTPLNNFKFNKTVYTALSSDIDANTIIEAIPEDPQATVTISEYNPALETIVIDVTSRNGVETQKYYISNAIGAPVFKMNGTEVSKIANTYGKSINISASLGTQSGTLVVAEYNNEQLVDIHPISGTGDIDIDINVLKSGVTMIKAFVWSDFDNIISRSDFGELR